jgi:hypothetical protein
MPAQVPFALLTLMVAVALGLGASWTMALLWLAIMSPVLFVRFILRGAETQITGWQRVVGALFVLGQAALVVAYGLDWWEDGCKSLHIIGLSGVIGSAMIAGMLRKSF